ncbi:MAG: hypothetical protein LCH66_02565 [Actinobacteria bacterium]|jgi:hypothetical protein|nr:hypothetical protein [Actinomycetota bacterium]
MALSPSARRWVAPVLISLPLTAALATFVAWRRPDQPFWLVVAVFTVVLLPTVATGLKVLVTDRATTDREIAAHQHDVETSWVKEAGSTAFFVLIGGLIFAETLGDVLRLSWLSPVGLPHVLVLGLGTFAVTYWYERRSAS